MKKHCIKILKPEYIKVELQTDSLETNQRMMMMLNQGKSANSSMITDDQNERFTEEDEEDDDRNEDSEKGTMSNMKNKRKFEDMEGHAVPFALDTR